MRGSGGGGQGGSTRGIYFLAQIQAVAVWLWSFLIPRSDNDDVILLLPASKSSFQKAKVVSVSYSPPCLSSFRTVSHNTHLMWLVWNLAIPTVIQRPRLGLPPRTCHLALPLVGKPHVQTHVTALCTLVSLVTWVLPLLYSHHPHCLPLLLVTYPLGEAQGSAQLETWGIPRTNRGWGLGCLPLNLSFGAKSQQWALRM